MKLDTWENGLGQTLFATREELDALEKAVARAQLFGHCSVVLGINELDVRVAPAGEDTLS